MLADKVKEPKQPRDKKKGKSKKKKQDNPSLEKSSPNPYGKKKPPSPCHICDEDHWTRDCPYRVEIKKFFKSKKTSTILTNPFLNPETNLVASDSASPYQVLMFSISEQQNEALISTRNKDYGNPQLLYNKAANQPSILTTSSTKVVPPIIP